MIVKSVKKTIISAYRGSIAHNLYIAPKDDKEFGTCDIDLMEIYCYGMDYYLGLDSYYKHKEHFEHIEGEDDIVGYELKKAIHLLRGCNPNIITILFNKKKHYKYLSEGGKFLIKNRHLFLAKDIIRDRFCGYANGQLKRLEGGAFKGYMGKKRKKIVEKYGLDTKNAMTLVRLLKNGIELLKDETVKVYRDEDRDFLLDIKRGKYSLEEVKGMADEYFVKVHEAYDKSKLPKKVDDKKINKLLLYIIKLENDQIIHKGKR